MMVTMFCLMLWEGLKGAMNAAWKLMAMCCVIVLLCGACSAIINGGL